MWSLSSSWGTGVRMHNEVIELCQRSCSAVQVDAKSWPEEASADAFVTRYFELHVILTRD